MDGLKCRASLALFVWNLDGASPGLKEFRGG